jgi:hypothetical protein
LGPSTSRTFVVPRRLPRCGLDELARAGGLLIVEKACSEMRETQMLSERVSNAAWGDALNRGSVDYFTQGVYKTGVQI